MVRSNRNRSFGVDDLQDGADCVLPGLVISRLGETSSWSRPCSVGSVSIGAGLQIGGELIDAVIILPDHQSLKAFTDDVQITLNGNASAAIGVGTGFRREFLSFQLNDEGPYLAQGHGFFFCRGAFVGASLDGTMVSVRRHVNRSFYGSELSARELLFRPAPERLQSTKYLNESLDEVFRNQTGP